MFLWDRLFADTRTPLYIFGDMIISWGGRHPAKPLLDFRHETVCFPLPGFGVVCVSGDASYGAQEGSATKDN